MSRYDIHNPDVREIMDVLVADDDRWDEHVYLNRRANLFDFVLPNIAVGEGIYDIQAAEQVASAGITHVVDCRGESNASEIWKLFPNVHYCWNGFPDDGRPKQARYFAGPPLSFALEALESGGVVLAHCAAGINRGPSMAYAILRAHTGLSPTEAFQAIQKVRPCSAIVYAADVEQAFAKRGIKVPERST